jgi:hypothetical protein
MRDEIFTYQELVTWHVRVQYDETKFNGEKLARTALIHLRDDELQAINVGQSEPLKLRLVQSFTAAKEAPDAALTVEEIMEACGHTDEIEFYTLDKRKELSRGTDQIQL